MRHTSGSLIFIPENAFGPACSAQIKIKYREIHNKVDMLKAAISMIYKENGKRRMLESAGMFEIYAECNGKALELAPNKTIQVRMKCQRILPDLQSFIFNKQKNAWEDAGLPVMDLSYRQNENNKDNTSLWGTPAVGGMIVRDSIGQGLMDSLGEAILVNSIMGKLPDATLKD